MEVEADEDSGIEVESNVSNDPVPDEHYNFPEENGRQYPHEGKYPFPIDEDELWRLDLQHGLIFRLLDSKLFLAPICNPQRILDVGTGTGMWAVDVADHHPSATVYGIDLCANQPFEVPFNCYFIVEDVEIDSDSTMQEYGPLDLLFLRGMAGSIEDWPAFLGIAFWHVQPGGYIEIQDFLPKLFSDFSDHSQAPRASYWLGELRDASAQAGRCLGIAQKLKQWLKRAGFTNVEQNIFQVPMNEWPESGPEKKIGKMQKLNILKAIDGMSLRLLTTQSKWGMEELQILLKEVRDEIKNTSLRMYWKYYVVYGQRPRDPE